MSEVQILSPRPPFTPLSPNKIKGFRQIDVVGLYKHLRHFTSKRWGTRWGTKWGTENQGKLALYGAKGARRGFCGRGRKFFHKKESVFLPPHLPAPCYWKGPGRNRGRHARGIGRPKSLQREVMPECKEVVFHVAGRVAERVEDALPFSSGRFDGRDERA